MAHAKTGDQGDAFFYGQIRYQQGAGYQASLMVQVDMPRDGNNPSNVATCVTNSDNQATPVESNMNSRWDCLAQLKAGETLSKRDFLVLGTNGGGVWVPTDCAGHNTIVLIRNGDLGGYPSKGYFSGASVGDLWQSPDGVNNWSKIGSLTLTK